MENKVGTAVIIALLVGLGGGALIGYAVAPEKEMMNNESGMSADMTPSMVIMEPSTDLRVAMNGLLKEHVNLGLATLRAAYDGGDSFEGAEAALDQNSVDLAAAVGSVYGADAEKQFLALWREHIGFFADYTVGLATDDQAKIDQAVRDLGGYAAGAGEFFSSANPNIDAVAVKELAMEHGKLIREAMAAYDKGDYAQSYELELAANDQVSKIADALTTGIVVQFPEKF